MRAIGHEAFGGAAIVVCVPAKGLVIAVTSNILGGGVEDDTKNTKGTATDTKGGRGGKGGRGEEGGVEDDRFVCHARRLVSLALREVAGLEMQDWWHDMRGWLGGRSRGVCVRVCVCVIRVYMYELVYYSTNYQIDPFGPHQIIQIAGWT